MLDTIWPIAPHTAAKHAILRRYLQAWFPKITSRYRKVGFIDGFAGPGEYLGGEPGSPLIALEVAVQHKIDMSTKELVYLFVEEDRQRYNHLAQVIGSLSLPNYIKIDHFCGSFVDAMGQVLNSLSNSMAPTLIMIDPFGVKGMPLDTIKQLAQFPKTEFLISLMYESMNRFMTTPEFEPHMDELYGTEEWRQAIEMIGSKEKHRFLVDLFTNQLKSCGMEFTRTFELKDAGNRNEYDLVFATHSIDGLKAIKDAMWKVDPSGFFVFSDATASTQQTLFTLEPNFAQLGSLIVDHFKGQTVSVDQIESFVLVDTAFRETHFKRQILGPMERKGEIVVISSPRQGNSGYPSGTQIRFS